MKPTLPWARVATTIPLFTCAVAFAQSVAPTYSVVQANRGATAFTSNCAACHGETLSGGPGTPPLMGPEFQFGWKGKSMQELISYMQEKMPPGGSGTLSRTQYTDIAALILQANSITPGTQDLSGDPQILASMKIAFP